MRTFLLSLVFMSVTACWFDPLSINVNVGQTTGDGDGNMVIELPITYADSDNIDDIDALVRVDGHLHIDATDITTLNMFDLVSVEGDLVIRNNGDLTVMNLSDLTSVGGTLLIEQNLALASVNAPRLTEVGGLTVRSNPALAFVAMDNLTDVRAALVWHSAGPETMLFPGLVSAGNVTVGAPSSFTTAGIAFVVFDSLLAVNGDFRFVSNADLVEVSSPSLMQIDGDLEVRANPTLTTVLLGDTGFIGGSACICENPLLPTCSAEELLNTFAVDDLPADISGNDDTASCN